MLTHGSLFSGIGGFDLGFERAGIKTLWQVECDPYALKVLEKHWPDVKRYTDVRSVHGVLAHATQSGQLRAEQQENDSSSTTRRGTDDAHQKGQGDCDGCLPRVDLISGGFPCQPFSVAGKRRGTDDDRHLWPEMYRIIEEVRPRWVVAENVPGLIKMALDQVLSDLEALGYTVGAVTVPACAVNAPHRRERLWILAHAKSIGSREETDKRSIDGASADVADTAQQLFDRHGHTGTAGRQESPDGGSDDANTNGQSARRSTKSRTEHCEWLPEPNVGRVAHGVPHRVDRLKALGNAIVPQIAEVIGHMILAVEHAH